MKLLLGILAFLSLFMVLVPMKGGKAGWLHRKGSSQWLTRTEKSKWMDVRAGSRHSDELERPVVEMAFPKKAISRIALFWGRRGTGKSLGMTYFGYLLHQLNKRRGYNTITLSNYQVSYADICDQGILRKITKFPDWAHDGRLMIDEITETMTSKRSMSRVAVETESLLTMVRKLRLELLCTAQFPHQLTGAVQHQIDFFIRTKMLYRPAVRYVNGRMQRYWQVGLKTFWYDWNGSITDRPHDRRNWPPREEDADHVRVDWGLEQMFGHYQTNEVIVSEHLEGREEIVARMQEQQEREKMLDDIFGEENFMVLSLFRSIAIREVLDGEQLSDAEFQRLCDYLGVDQIPDANTGELYAVRPNDRSIWA